MVFQKLELLRGEPRQTIGGKPRQESVPKIETHLLCCPSLEPAGTRDNKVGEYKI